MRRRLRSGSRGAVRWNQYEDLVHSIAGRRSLTDPATRRRPTARRPGRSGKARQARAPTFAAMWGRSRTGRATSTRRWSASLGRDGYRIEKMLFQSRPDALGDGQRLCALTPTPLPPGEREVRGRRARCWQCWRSMVALCLARRDPVVQARCPRLAKVEVSFALGARRAGAGVKRAPDAGNGDVYTGRVAGGVAVAGRADAAGDAGSTTTAGPWTTC